MNNLIRVLLHTRHECCLLINCVFHIPNSQIQNVRIFADILLIFSSTEGKLLIHPQLLIPRRITITSFRANITRWLICSPPTNNPDKIFHKRHKLRCNPYPVLHYSSSESVRAYPISCPQYYPPQLSYLDSQVVPTRYQLPVIMFV